MLRILFLTLIVFLSLDFIFLYSMSSIFNKQIIAIQGSPIVFNFYAGILCYIALVFGIYYFIIREKKSILEAFLLGFIINAVYETTTLTFLKNWSYKIAIIDTLWGGVLFALTTFIVYALEKPLRLK